MDVSRLDHIIGDRVLMLLVIFHAYLSTLNVKVLSTIESMFVLLRFLYWDQFLKLWYLLAAGPLLLSIARSFPNKFVY